MADSYGFRAKDVRRLQRNLLAAERAVPGIVGKLSRKSETRPHLVVQLAGEVVGGNPVTVYEAAVCARTVQQGIGYTPIEPELLVPFHAFHSCGYHPAGAWVRLAWVDNVWQLDENGLTYVRGSYNAADHTVTFPHHYLDPVTVAVERPFGEPENLAYVGCLWNAANLKFDAVLEACE